MTNDSLANPEHVLCPDCECLMDYDRDDDHWYCRCCDIGYLRYELEHLFKIDPMENHKCNIIASVPNCPTGRTIELGILTEPIPGYPGETHCLHITTPFKKGIIFGLNLGDALVMATFAQIIHGKQINPTSINHRERVYKG